MDWNKPPQKKGPLGKKGKKGKKDDKKKKSLPPNLSKKSSPPSPSKEKGLSSGSSEIRALKIPSSVKGPTKKNREISSDQIPTVGAKRKPGTPSKNTREPSESSEIAALSAENPEEEVPPSVQFLNKFVMIFFIAFGSLYCLGLGFFFSANKRPPTSISDLVSVVTGLKRVFKSSSPPTKNLDESLGDFEDAGEAPDKNMIKKARAKKEEGEDALIIGRRTSDQKKIREAQKLFQESMTLFKKAINLERDSATRQKLEEEIVDLQNSILDCGKSLNFGG